MNKIISVGSLVRYYGSKKLYVDSKKKIDIRNHTGKSIGFPSTGKVTVGYEVYPIGKDGEPDYMQEPIRPAFILDVSDVFAL
jgi:hypothetical protein